jgi:hypothetical protein
MASSNPFISFLLFKLRRNYCISNVLYGTWTHHFFSPEDYSVHAFLWKFWISENNHCLVFHTSWRSCVIVKAGCW